MRLFTTAATVALVATASGAAHAQAAYETLAQSVESALRSNPALLAERQARGVAQERVAEARGAMLPSIGVRGTYGTYTANLGEQYVVGGQSFPRDGDFQQATLGLEARQTIYAGGMLAAQRRQAEAGSDAAAQNLRAFEQDLILSVVAAFTDVQRAEEAVRIREANQSALGEHVRAATDRFDVGQVTRTDVAQAQARKAEADASLAAARAQREAARAVYQQVVGLPAIQLAPVPAGPVLPATMDNVVAQALANNPDVLSARAAEAAASQGVNVARGSLRPRVGIVGTAGMQESYRDDTIEDTNLGLFAELSIPLYQGGVLNARTRGAKLEAERARYGRMAAERAATAEATTAWHQYMAATEAVTASRSRLEAADVALEGSRQELLVGTRITLDVLDQEQETLEARLGLIRAQRDAYIAAHQLLAVMGRLTPDMIGR